jgi:hypothetical protein
MSQFMPDSPDPGKRNKPGDDVPPDYLTPDERKALSRQLGYPEDIPKKFKTWMLDYIAVNGLDIPVSQLHGFTGFKPRIAISNSTAATQATSWTDLGGPELEGLASGSYLILFGYANSTATFDGSYATGQVGVSINGADPTSNIIYSTEGTNEYFYKTYYYAATVEGNGDNNTVGLRYKLSSQTGAQDRDWDGAWLVAIKTGN